MRETVNRLLDPDSLPETLPPAIDELEELTKLLRGHVELLAPEVAELARGLTPKSVRRFTVQQSVWEAESRLAAEPIRRYGGALGYARRLARVLNALCDHYEALAS
jgi:hypothetical protein